MFSIKIHTVDTAEPLYRTKTTTTNSTSSSGNPITQLRGLIHLFRQSSSSYLNNSNVTLSNPAARSTLLFIVAVPNYISPDDFLLFCGSQLHDFNQLIFLRNDGVEDRYSVLIKLNNQLSSDGFYCNFNGKRFQPSQAEVCHIYFIQSVEYTELSEIAGAPPPAFVELPTCPVCLERLDHDTSAIQTTLCDHSFHCSCVSRWTYLSCQVCQLCQQQDEKPMCAVCGSLNNPWVCLICGFVGCGRYKEGHAIKHWNDTQHCYSLELETQQIWDYVGDKYVHRLNQSKNDSKSVMTNFHCTSDDGGCGTFGSNEDYSVIGDAIFSSKVEQLVDEYNHLLATQMETQRQHYETLLTEAKSRRENSIAKAVEMAEVTMTQNLQDRIEEITKEKKAAADMNEELVKKQENLRKRLKDIEHREISSSNSKDEKIRDLKEQIRDLKVNIEAQRTLSGMTDADGIKGGTLLPIQSNQSSASAPKRRTKSGRKRN